MILQQEASNFKGTQKVLPEIWAGMHRSLFFAVAFDEFTGDLLFEESRTEKIFIVKMHSLKFHFKTKIMEEKELSLQVINSRAAGIDVGSRFHMVAIDQNKENVKQFGVYTCDHEKLIDHLRGNEITTIAMESTGTYWQPLFNALQSSGFEVLLVGGNQTKNVKGRKTDVLDCMWIQKLHSLGLLSGSFLLTDIIGSLRTYYYHRQHLVEQSAMYINKMQKALRLMNIRLDVVIRDITSKSGLNIIEAILSGQRDAHYLASLVDIRVKRSVAEIAEGLHGWWREELLFRTKKLPGVL